MINRNNLVARHRIRLTQPDASSPLLVGNGEFARQQIFLYMVFPRVARKNHTQLKEKYCSAEGSLLSMGEK